MLLAEFRSRSSRQKWRNKDHVKHWEMVNKIRMGTYSKRCLKREMAKSPRSARMEGINQSLRGQDATSQKSQCVSY